MMPGEAERKLHKLEEEHTGALQELACYKRFFEASLAMNIAAAGLPQAMAVHDAMRELEVIRIRRGIKDSTPSALAALKNITKEKD